MNNENQIKRNDKKVLFIAHDDKFVKHFLTEHKKTFELLEYSVYYAVNNKYGSFDNDVYAKVLDIDIQQSPFKLTKNFKAFKQILKFIKQENISVIYAHTPVGGVLGRLVKFFNKNLIVIYLPHGYHFLKGSSILSWIAYYPIEKVLSHLTDLIITINKEDYLLTRKKMSKKMDVQLINGVGVNINHADLEFRARDENDIFNITHVAELNDNKNQLCLLKAVKLLIDKSNQGILIPKFKVYFIGEGRNLELLKDYVQQNNLGECVEFLGYIDNVDDYLYRSDCAVSCSRREGLPVNLIESLSYGIPIVATNCRGNRDVVQNGVNGYLTQFNNENELADRIMDVMFEKSEYLANFYDNNIMKSKIYSNEVVNKQLYSIFSDLLIK